MCFGRASRAGIQREELRGEAAGDRSIMPFQKKCIPYSESP
jgi:hypothetical protein